MKFTEEQILNIIKPIQAEQNYVEACWIANKVCELNPLTIMEIGTRRGGTLIIWDTILREVNNNLLIAMDMVKHQDFNHKNFKSNLKFLELDSRNDSSKDSVIKTLNGRFIDFLYIDGDHGYEACKNDYNTYSPFVRDGGIIGFHDTRTEKRNVGRFFSELKGNKEVLELGQGTGIYYK